MKDNNPKIGVAVKCLLLNGENILLVRQVKDHDNFWIAPGGKCEVGETLSACLIREMIEELNLSIESTDQFTEFDSEWQGRKDRLHCFACQVSGREFVINPQEIREAQWFHLNALPPLGPTTMKILQLWREQKPRL